MPVGGQRMIMARTMRMAASLQFPDSEFRRINAYRVMINENPSSQVAHEPEMPAI